MQKPYLQVWLGPNAVLAFHREGYGWSDISLGDLRDVLSFPGFYRLAAKYAGFGASEMIKSWFMRLSGGVLQSI